MKKLMCAFLCVVLIFSMAACGNGGNSESGAGGSGGSTRKEVTQTLTATIASKDRNRLSVREFATAKRNNDIVRLRHSLQTNIPMSRMLKSRISKARP